MPKWISDSDLERIKRFAESPMYQRSPEMLLPEGENEESKQEEPSERQSVNRS